MEPRILDYSTSEETSSDLSIGESLFGFFTSGNVPDDSERMRLNELRKKGEEKTQIRIVELWNRKSY